MTALHEGHRLGPYRIVRLLGEGGMGAVYEARQEPLDRKVALKTLHAESAGNKDAVSRFFNEAKTMSRLEHPSIVQVSDFGTSADGTAYLVMEYLRGQSLGRRLREYATRGERLPLITVLQIGFQIADVLAIAHSQGIVHRDIKPENLMLIEDAVAPGGERVKVLDFGIAKLIHDGDKGGVKTATQTVMGTPSYMSPEQCAGAGGVDAKTDVYALGCVLYEVFSGRPPFVAAGPGQLIGMHLFQTPPPLLSLAPKMPEAVADLIHRLLDKDKERRPSMTEAADAIGKLVSKQTGSGPVVRSRPPGRIDAGAEPGAPLPIAGTTLGRSLGQQVSGSPRRAVLLGVTLVAFIGSGALLAARLRGPQPGSPQAAVQPTPATLTPAFRPDLLLPASPVARPSAAPPAADVPPTAAQPPAAAKPDPPSTQKAGSATAPRPASRANPAKGAGSPPPPAIKPPPKKQIEYVPL